MAEPQRQPDVRHVTEGQQGYCTNLHFYHPQRVVVQSIKSIGGPASAELRVSWVLASRAGCFR